MKIALYSRAQSSHPREELEQLLCRFRERDIELQINEEFAQMIEELTGEQISIEDRYSNVAQIDDQSSVLISYGGDGTFLDAVRLLEGSSLPIVGINSGRLGFLATVAKSEVGAALDALLAGDYTLHQRPLLGVEASGCAEIDYPYAFNEFAMLRGGGDMIEAEMEIDGEAVATLYGDGVLLSTPAGSTAYCLSVGGPVVAPACGCLVVAPIAPHNLTMRPLVIPDSSEILFRVRSRDPQFFVSLDNRNYSVCQQAEFRVRRSPRAVTLVRLQGESFYQTLKQKMMWGIDGRNATHR